MVHSNLIVVPRRERVERDIKNVNELRGHIRSVAITRQNQVNFASRSIVSQKNVTTTNTLHVIVNGIGHDTTQLKVTVVTRRSRPCL